MQVLVLEDLLCHQVRLETLLRELADEFGQKLDIRTTGKLHEFMAYHEQAEVHQLYFLDIEIKNDERSGLEIAREIRDKNPYSIIVFVSAHPEFALLTFQYQAAALDFISKDVSDTVFKKRLRKILDYSFKQSLDVRENLDLFDYTSQGERMKVPFQDILYIETAQSSHKLRMVGKNFIKEFHGTLKELSQFTDSQGQNRFFRPHKSYLANVENIRGWDSRKKVVLFQGHVTCPLSRLRIPALKELLNQSN